MDRLTAAIRLVSPSLISVAGVRWVNLLTVPAICVRGRSAVVPPVVVVLSVVPSVVVVLSVVPPVVVVLSVVPSVVVIPSVLALTRTPAMVVLPSMTVIRNWVRNGSLNSVTVSSTLALAGIDGGANDIEDAGCDFQSIGLLCICRGCHESTNQGAD